MEAIVAAMYKLGKQLGSGAFGIIYEGTCIATDRKVAIKIVSFNRLMWQEQSSRQNLVVEYRILWHLQGERKFYLNF